VRSVRVEDGADQVEGAVERRRGGVEFRVVDWARSVS
jgi:hypothetical protein